MTAETGGTATDGGGGPLGGPCGPELSGNSSGVVLCACCNPLSEYPPAPPPVDDRRKYSLLTQFRRQSGILPMIARRISLAAISRSSVVAASL